MNVTEESLRSYIEAFHRSLEVSAREFLPPEYRSELFHASLLPARITGYVSTQFGVAIEYERAPETSIQIVRGSARIEDLFVQAPPQTRAIGLMFNIAAPGTGFAKLTLSGGFPFRLASQNASVSFEDVAFEIGQWKRVVLFAEVSGNRDAANWNIGKAESRAKDEVLAAMLQLTRANERKISISDYIREFKSKTILVLGDYDPEGSNRLHGIAQSLVALGYDPILVKDIPDHPHHDLPQKVVAIGAISRFVIVDDSSKSGHLLEVQLCKINNWVTVLLRAGGVGGSWMTAGASHASNVINELPYDPSSPSHAIGNAVQWAEAKLQELQRKFEGTYPWRARS
ncbi:MAG: hypothetical protein HY273_10540 [Gammaproteobacteria bacterium]|nr:hypothetical protein [Gammaproteobacteria bacterium]